MGQENAVFTNPVVVKEVQKGVVVATGANASKKIPSTTKLENISGYWQVKNNGSYWNRHKKTHYLGNDNRKLFQSITTHRTALRLLNQKGYVTLQDLEGISLEKIEQITGASKTLTQRIFACVKAADVTARGTGYPYDFMVKVFIPLELTKSIGDFSCTEVQKAAVNFLEENGFFEQIKNQINKVKVKELREKQLQISQQLEKVEAELTKRRGAA